MEFFYPNFINDFWRIMGLVFFGDRDRFVDAASRKFKVEEIKAFCSGAGIAMFDTASAVRRLKDNASDKFLEVMEPTDIPSLLRRIPSCRAVVTTGEKATQTLCASLGIEAPAVGAFNEYVFEGRKMRFYRMPSTSRAYPLPIPKKADVYRRLFKEIGMVSS